MRRRMRAPTARGFSLVELVVVMAIIAIIAKIAYPSYLDSVRKARRAEAKAELLSNAQKLERCFTASATYVGCVIVAGNTTSGYYSLTPASPTVATATLTTSTYTLEATALGDQLKDTKCKSFSLNEKGVKSAKDSANAVSSDCW